MTLFFICVPFLGFMTRGNFLKLQNLDITVILSSLWVSLLSSLIAMVVIIVVGIPAGYFLAKTQFKYKSLLNILLNLPQVLPPAVIGLLLLLTYGNNGYLGSLIARLGIQTTFSRLAVILTFIFVALPIFIKGVSVAFLEIDPKLEQAALLLGDSPMQVFWRISCPLARKGTVVALMMAWSRGISEFGATMMFAGNLPGVTQTLPLAIYTALESNLNNALFLSFLMFLVSLMVLVGIYLLTEGRK